MDVSIPIKKASLNLTVGQQQLTLGHGHHHVMGLSQTREHDLSMEEQNNDELTLGSGDGHEMEQQHDHSGNDGEDYEQDNELDIDRKVNHDGRELALRDHDDELALVEGNELVVSGDNELDDNLELALDHSQEMGMEEADDLGIQEPDYVIGSPPVVQAQTLAISPTHEVHVGQEFPDVKSCLRALRDTAITLHFEIQMLPGAPTLTIRTLHESHTCSRIAHLGHQQASVQWVASSVERRLKENPNCKPKEILEEIHRVHGITLSYKQAWRGKERIMAAMRGSFEEGYRLLPQYCEQIKHTIPGSIASVYGNPTDNSFQRLFISPLLWLDRAYLKSKYLDTLLLATGFDGDAQAVTVIEFESEVLEIEEVSQDAAYWIRSIPPRLWATWYFEGSRLGHLPANIVESLNNWLLEASGMPIIQMECIRR
ncbi:hypothetical protein AKJ16_DCAP17577 [Drosera capensis]